jgi:hypothetical protein
MIGSIRPPKKVIRPMSGTTYMSGPQKWAPMKARGTMARRVRQVISLTFM